jgi:hypothetical protein
MSDPGPFAVATADPDLVERVLRETGVDRRLPAPSWAGYVQDLVEAAIHGLVGWMRPFLKRLAPLLGGDLEIPALVLFIAITVTLLYLLVRTAVSRVRRRRAPRSAAEPSPVTASVPTAAFDPEQWRRRLEALLARGDVAPALEALWWWLARTLSGEHASPTWTSRELLAFARRSDLLPLAARLDRMIYGGTPPRPDEIRGLVARFEEALA